MNERVCQQDRLVDARLSRFLLDADSEIIAVVNCFCVVMMLQIIMCCIYAVCKVVDQEIKFKKIVSEYRQLPNTSQQVASHLPYRWPVVTLDDAVAS